MPELPEAETIARGLALRITGRTVSEVEVLHPDVLAVDSEVFRKEVEGRRITGVDRRGKNVVISLADERRIVVNLGMTGKLLVGGGESTHPAVVFSFRDGGELVYDDVRRFGRVECLTREGWRIRDRELGVEPLSDDFTAHRLHDLLGRSSSPLRSWLLDQRRVAGVGNIYAVEALWEARLHPRRPANQVDEGQTRRLHRALRTVLRRAVQAGGTTIRDYRNADGDRGTYASRLAAYGREGESCPRCGTAIERLVFANRSAFLCPTCQPPAPDA